MEKSVELQPRVILLLGVLGASFSSILVRWAAAPSIVTAAMRLLCTVALLTPVVLWRHRAALRAVKGRDILLCAASGLLLALHFATWFESLKRTSVASSTVLVSTEVIFTAIGFAVFLKGRIPRLGLLAILLAFGGSVFVALGPGNAGGGAVAGNLLALAGAVFVSGYTLIGRVQRGHLSTTVYTWLTYCASAVCLVGFVLAGGESLAGWPAREWGIGLALAVCCTLLGHSLFSWSLKYLSPAYVAASKLCEPVFASLLAALLFAEVPAPVQLVGYAVIIGGVWLYTQAEKRQGV